MERWGDLALRLAALALLLFGLVGCCLGDNHRLTVENRSGTAITVLYPESVEDEDPDPWDDQAPPTRSVEREVRIDAGRSQRIAVEVWLWSPRRIDIERDGCVIEVFPDCDQDELVVRASDFGCPTAAN